MHEVGSTHCKYQSERTRLGKYYLVIIAGLIFTTYGISGYTGERANFILLGLCVFWFVVSGLANPKAFASTLLRRKTFCFMLFILFYLVTSLPTAGVYNTFKYVGAFLILYSPMFMFSYYEYIGNARLLKLTLYSIYVVWAIFGLRALNFYYLNPGAARRLVSNREAFGDIAIGGGYPLSIGSAILAVFLLELIINSVIKEKKIKLASCVLFVILVLVVIETRSTITLLALIVGLLISLSINLFRNRRGEIKLNYRLIIVSCALLILVLLFFININNFGYFIMEQTSSSDNALFRRLYEVGLELASIGSSNVGSNYLWSRLTLLSDSLELFVSSPFIGNGFSYGYDFYSSKLLGIGNHSEWLDILAIYGLFGGLPLLAVYYFAIKEIKKYTEKNAAITYVFVAFFLGLFNPFQSFQSHLIILFVIPSSYILFKKTRDMEV